MASRMWRLEEFQYDWGIPGREVSVFGADGPSDDMPKGLAIDLAHEQGLHLVPEWPARPDADHVSCRIVKLSLPLR